MMSSDESLSFSEPMNYSAVEEEVDHEEQNNHVVNTSRSKGVASDALVIKWAHQMVEDCTDSHPDVICWAPEGDRFEVKDIQALEDNILGQYFNTQKFASFARQMNKYSFQKWRARSIKKNGTKLGDIITFKHEHFRRGRLDLLVKVKKPPKKVNTTKVAMKSTEELESLKRKLHDLEERHTELRSSIKSLEYQNVEHKTHIKMLQDFDTAKDEKIQKLELRLLALTNPFGAGQHQLRQLPSLQSPSQAFHNDSMADKGLVDPYYPLGGVDRSLSIPYGPIHSQRMMMNSPPNATIASNEEPTLPRQKKVKSRFDHFFDTLQRSDTEEIDGRDDQMKMVDMPLLSNAATAACEQAGQSLSRQNTTDSWLDPITTSPKEDV